MDGHLVQGRSNFVGSNVFKERITLDGGGRGGEELFNSSPDEEEADYHRMIARRKEDEEDERKERRPERFINLTREGTRQLFKLRRALIAASSSSSSSFSPIYLARPSHLRILDD